MTPLELSLVERLKAKIADGEQHRQIGTAATFAPATQSSLEMAERDLGFPLPPLLAQVYTSVANGGFGPGYGLIGLDGGAKLDTGDSVVSLYQSFLLQDPDDPLWHWPASLLAICHWGCGIYSCVDCGDQATPVLRFDPNGHKMGHPWDEHFRLEVSSFAGWIEMWLNDQLPFDLP